MKKYKKNLLFGVLLFVSTLIWGNNGKSSSEENHRKTLFDRGWKFYRGEATDAQTPSFDDSSWRHLDLPHDWSIEPLANQEPDKVVGPFSRKSREDFGFANGQTVGGQGWYRKTFTISPSDADKRHELYFEGIYNHSEVWVNGRKAYYNIYGYTSFRLDITDYCNPTGEENVIAVKVLNEGRNSRWYSGSGIYRHVWLIRTSRSYIEDWGTFVSTTVKDNQAIVSLSTNIINGNKSNEKLSIDVGLISPQGKRVAETTQEINIASGDTIKFPFALNVTNPELWSTETPHLYTVKISLRKKNKKQDELSIPFGIRTIRFSAENGFELNGISMKLKGGCVHHDNGLLGAMAFDRAEERKIELLKKNGFNAVRTSHNPMSESFMNACDRLGMLVINEIFDQWKGRKNPQGYFLYFEEWSAKDIRNFILRDRNHPSVIMWSIGNEIRERRTDEGVATAAYLKKEIYKYDSTRPITAGINSDRDKQGNLLPRDTPFLHLDVSGYNYMWQQYEEDHQIYPQRVIYGSETVAKEAFQNWNMVEKHPYVVGDFVWTAMDYLGEAGLGNTVEVEPEANVHQFMDWPWFNAWCGDLDILGVKKPQSYYRDVLWDERTITMAVETPVAEGKIYKISFWGWPEESLSWTFPGMEGKAMKVNVYTRAPKVRLYLNDHQIGEQATSEAYTTTFQVPYSPGILKAVELKDDIEASETTLKTTGTPVALKLTADNTTPIANGQDLSYILIELVDKEGKTVLNSDRRVYITSQGAGKVIGSGNASPTDMESFGSLTPSLFKGRAMAIIRTSYDAGDIKLTVTADGLPPSTVTIRAE